MELGQLPIVSGSETELREALTNLIHNAVDAMPEGGVITIRTYVEDVAQSERDAKNTDPGRVTASRSRRVVLAVSDTGTGMTEEVRRRCLEPFFTTKGEHGTGLGLGMVHGIVRRHEGTIEIESEWGKGTTFIIGLPVYVHSETQESENAPGGTQ
jgi:signal transduction histidine kinase